MNEDLNFIRAIHRPAIYCREPPLVFCPVGTFGNSPLHGFDIRIWIHKKRIFPVPQGQLKIARQFIAGKRNRPSSFVPQGQLEIARYTDLI
jgi:hypothetical protein